MGRRAGLDGRNILSPTGFDPGLMKPGHSKKTINRNSLWNETKPVLRRSQRNMATGLCHGPDILILLKDLPVPTGIRVGSRASLDILEEGKNSPPIFPSEIES